MASPLKDFRLSRDPAAFHAIFHDPSVAPFVFVGGGAELADLTPLLEDPANVGFLYDGAAFLAHWREPGCYEVHSAALPHRRGRYAVEAARLAIRAMFLASDAFELWTKVVDGNKGALGLTRLMGFAHEFDRPSAWQAEDGPRDVSFYALRYSEWIKRQDWLKASGEWFHGLLGETQTHAPDPVHDLYVGSAVEMVLSGQADKGVGFYNRWARMAGYQPISIASYDPLTIHIGTHLVTVRDGKLEVETCQ